MLLKNYIKQCLGFVVFSLLLTACGKNTGSSQVNYEYLAVQIEKGDNWSIMDSNGKIVVKEEYAPKDEISFITSDGVYWVKSNDDDKFRLYSVESPKKPISKGEYVYVTNFINGNAFCSDGLSPIQVVDTKGNIKKTLPKEIRGVRVLSKYSSDGVLYSDNVLGGKAGLLDFEGNIVTKAQYSEIYSFSDGVAVVEKDNEYDKLYIIGRDGKEKGVIDLNRYKVVSYEFREGKLPVLDLNDNKRLLYLDKKGDVALEVQTKLSADWEATFIDGYAVVSCENNLEGVQVVDDIKGVAFVGKYGVINDKGEIVIRVGKYDRICNFGNGKFLVATKNGNGKYYVVDSDDNPITDDYNGAILLPVVDKFAMWDRDNYILVDSNGNEMKNSEFANFADQWFRSVMFSDINQMATDIVDKIDPKGYIPIQCKQNLKDIVNVLKIDVEKQKRGNIFIEIDSFKADIYDVVVSLQFDKDVLIEKTHKEVVNDGWFSHEKTVSDGWGCNDDAKLFAVAMDITELDSNLDVELLKEIVGKKLKEKGFKVVADGPYYEIKNGDKYSGVYIGGTQIAFYPYKEYSEKLDE